MSTRSTGSETKNKCRRLGAHGGARTYTPPCAPQIGHMQIHCDHVQVCGKCGGTCCGTLLQRRGPQTQKCAHTPTDMLQPASCINRHATACSLVVGRAAGAHLYKPVVPPVPSPGGGEGVGEGMGGLQARVWGRPTAFSTVQILVVMVVLKGDGECGGRLGRPQL